MSLSGYDAYSTSGSPVSKYSWGMEISSPLSGTYTGYAFYNHPATVTPSIFDKNPQFECMFNFFNNQATTECYIIIGGSAGVTDTASEKKFGIHIVGGYLRIISSDGTTQTETEDLIQLNTNTWYRIRCKLFSENKIEVWVDNISVGTKTDYRPSGTQPATTQAFPQLITKGTAIYPQTIRYAGLKVAYD